MVLRTVLCHTDDGRCFAYPVMWSIDSAHPTIKYVFIVTSADIETFPETICDNGKYVKYLVTILRQLFFTCCRDIVVDWCELFICPIEYH